MSGRSDEVRVGVMGAGAIGCWVGGRLREGGLDVTLIGRERLMKETGASGLTVSDLDGHRAHLELDDRLRISADPTVLKDADVVLVSVKSSATREAGETLAKILRPDAISVSLQNGVRNAAILRETAGGRAVLAGIVGFNVVAKPGGVYHRATSGPLIVEHSSDPWIARIAEVLGAQGLEVRLVKDITRLQWAKLIVNLNNAVSALSDQPTRSLLLSSAYRRVLAATMGEAVGVLRAAGIKPARLGPIPVSMFPALLRLPTPIFRLLARAQLKLDPEARSSMWDDLMRGRVTEVDELNGEIVELARSRGLDASINRRTVELVHAVESKRTGSPKLSAEALWGQLVKGA